MARAGCILSRLNVQACRVLMSWLPLITRKFTPYFFSNSRKIFASSLCAAYSLSLVRSPGTSTYLMPFSFARSQSVVSAVRMIVSDSLNIFATRRQYCIHVSLREPCSQSGKMCGSEMVAKGRDCTTFSLLAAPTLMSCAEPSSIHRQSRTARTFFAVFIL